MMSSKAMSASKAIEIIAPRVIRRIDYGI